MTITAGNYWIQIARREAQIDIWWDSRARAQTQRLLLVADAIDELEGSGRLYDTATTGAQRKAALECANTMLAMALSPLVRVVGVAPGLTLTSAMLSPEKFEQLHKLAPLGKSSTPEDIAGTVLFAMQNKSITGTTLLVDGGQHLMRFDRDFSLM